jgi:hypothetical protein
VVDPVFQDEVLALDIPQLAETLREGLAALVADSARGAWREGEIRDPGDGPWQLRFGCKPSREESDGEDDEAPDGAAPYGGRLPLASCPPSMTVNTADRRAHDLLLAARSRACSSRVDHHSYSVPGRRPARVDWASSRPPLAAGALALLLAFGSANPWHEDWHLARSVPCLAHTTRAERRAIQRVRSSEC